MKARDVMTDHVELIDEEATIFEAAEKMREFNIGTIIASKKDHLAGMLTDRDIVLRCVAKGLDPKTTRVVDCMSWPIIYIHDDIDVADAARTMEENKIRRLPVINKHKRLVGILTLSDLSARWGNEKVVGRTMKTVAAATAYAG